ncbi:zincin-like metallopeptidase domain-containing protein [Sphingomonas sp. ACRSK]|uniref:zincin-like metallopeptidase domain-containing protein n=1 Tax=Sphingomonas sp. ACRSK TaxID=2918213 RepID=UPI001EF6C432|nr:zincin-like metallopeptidase domain-containing protein [Sphingomonas sp. ACRSK]MCG7349721.1 zincin-like metallopeptidase domain-containing protein [Sphingomonas sp. ACRSK]
MKPGRENAAGIHIGAGLSGYVAELGAAFVSGAIGIKLHDREDHAAYLASWLQALRNDKRCIFTAATQAQAAADWLLSRMGAESAAPMEEAA